jgi:hypothetical protein
VDGIIHASKFSTCSGRIINIQKKGKKKGHNDAARIRVATRLEKRGEHGKWEMDRYGLLREI